MGFRIFDLRLRRDKLCFCRKKAYTIQESRKYTLICTQITGKISYFIFFDNMVFEIDNQEIVH
jgi:hypothetical protein